MFANRQHTAHIRLIEPGSDKGMTLSNIVKVWHGLLHIKCGC